MPPTSFILETLLFKFMIFDYLSVFASYFLINRCLLRIMYRSIGRYLVLRWESFNQWMSYKASSTFAEVKKKISIIIDLGEIKPLLVNWCARKPEIVTVRWTSQGHLWLLSCWDKIKENICSLYESNVNFITIQCKSFFLWPVSPGLDISSLLFSSRA